MDVHGDRPVNALFPAILSPAENRNMKHEITSLQPKSDSRTLKHEIYLIIINTFDNLEKSEEISFLMSSKVKEATFSGL